ncbi:MAG: bifunctional phosphopantothenoylcysteine decarboxylase/phosphopantothenate--cysteine ligase CoaBC [Gemmatimonadaceae bacterium]
MLGVSGGIAAYKSVSLARLLTQAGAQVDVVLTRAALEFVGAITFEAVTGRQALAEIFEPGHALDHIRLAREADVVVIAPATADLMARAAHGHADDLLTASLLATSAPVLFVPAMNDHMWAHPQTGRNVAHLREIGYRVLDPDEGPLAVGEGSGPGRMPEPDTIFAHLGRILESDNTLRGRRVLVTTGATREPVDPVRFISNHSTGKMGAAIAAAAWRRGADVTLIAGHTDVPLPGGPRVVRADTTEAMARAVAGEIGAADALIMAAAPADFTVKSAASSKMKREGGTPTLDLVETADILKATSAARKKGSVVVGFALETGDAARRGEEKLRGKSLDMIVVNDQNEEGAGFGGDTNRVTLLSRGGKREELPLMLKTELAETLLDRVGAMLNGP